MKIIHKDAKKIKGISTDIKDLLSFILSYLVINPLLLLFTYYLFEGTINSVVKTKVITMSFGLIIGHIIVWIMTAAWNALKKKTDDPD